MAKTKPEDQRRRLQITVSPETYNTYKNLIPHTVQSALMGKLMESLIKHLQQNEHSIDAFIGAALEGRVVVEITSIIPRGVNPNEPE